MEHQFRSGASNYTIHCTRGRVAGKDKNLETKISGGGGGGYIRNGNGHTAPVTIRSRTVVHDKIYLELEHGKQKALELTDWDVACMQGHDLMVLWVVRNNKTTSSYLALKNFTTDEVTANQHAIKTIADQHYLLFGENNITSGIGLLLTAVLTAFTVFVLYKIGGTPLFLLGLAGIAFYEIRTRIQSAKVAGDIKRELNGYFLAQEAQPAIAGAVRN